MNLREIMGVLRRLAPEHLAEPWDKVGLQVGDEDRSIRKAMLCIDLTPEVMREAVAKRVGLVVSYHPLIFKPLEGLRQNYHAPWQEKVVAEAVRRGIAVYTPHTALDAARGGVNDWLCEGLGKGRATAIQFPEPGESFQFKIVTFVPATHAERVRQALFATSAGGIGKYKECSFNSTGQGTFRPGKGAKPFLGETGRLETVEEVRIEMLCGSLFLGDAIAALRKAHPYEEPAFDILPRREPPAPYEQEAGQGRWIGLDEPVSVETLASRIKRHLKVPRVEIAVPGRESRDVMSPKGEAVNFFRTGKIRTVAVCAGAGGSVLEKCRLADAYFTGEMRHHEVLAHLQLGKVVILAGHTQTERPYLPVYRKRIIKAGGGKGVQWLVSRADRPPSKAV